MKTYKKGISLIVLVVTIIVMAILAATVIISLSNANIIENANKTTFKNDMSSYKEAFELHVASETARTNGTFDRTSLTTADLPTILGDNLKDKYADGLKVVDGKLVYETEDDIQKSVLQELGMVAGNATNAEVITNYTQDDIDNSGGKLVAIGATDSLYVVAAYNDDKTEVTITKNRDDSDGKIKAGGFEAPVVNSNVQTVIMEYGITYIGNEAFSGCSSLTTITMPNTITQIGNYAFQQCASLTSITIPSSVTSIGSEIFSECAGLTSIVVNPGNSVYHSNGNCLIETASKTLIAGCKASIIPNDNSITSIGDSAFSYKDITSVTISTSVTSIGDNAFYGCSNLTSITYLGTKAEWNSIELGSYWNFESGDYTIHCTDGDIAKS